MKLLLGAVTAGRYVELTELLSRCMGIRTLSQLVRKILDGRKIVTVIHDKSIDPSVERLREIRMELHR